MGSLLSPKTDQKPFSLSFSEVTLVFNVGVLTALTISSHFSKYNIPISSPAKKIKIGIGIK